MNFDDLINSRSRSFPAPGGRGMEHWRVSSYISNGPDRSSDIRSSSFRTKLLQGGSSNKKSARIYL